MSLNGPHVPQKPGYLNRVLVGLPKQQNFADSIFRYVISTHDCCSYGDFTESEWLKT